jgi:ankyrin repeat protein
MKLALILGAVLALAQAPPLTKAEQLQDAARKGDAATVKKLLDEGVDVNTKFRYNATALFYACDHGHLEVVKVLLDHGADMSVKDTFYGFTPLMLATGPAQKKKPEHTEIAKLLIAKGAPGKELALNNAIQGGDAALAKVILASGGIAPNNLSDALEMAKSRNKAEMVTLLEGAGAKPYEDFKIDPSILAMFGGTYKAATGNEITVAVAGPRITLGPAAAPPEQRLMLLATGEKTFKAIGAPIVIAFQMDGAKVSGFTLTQGQNPPTIFTRVEGKQP